MYIPDYNPDTNTESFETPHQMKKRILKRRLMAILSNAIFWLFIGYLAGFISITYGVTETLKTLDKVVISK